MNISSSSRQWLPAVAVVLISLFTSGGRSQTPLFGGSKPAAPAGSGTSYILEIKENVLAPKGARKDPQPAELRNLVEVLREEHPDVNIVVSPGVSRIAIDDLKLRTASLEDELEALCVASGGQFIWERRGANPGPTSPPVLDPNTGLPLPPGYASATALASGSSLYILREPNVPVESRRKAEAFNLTGYLQSSGKTDEKPVADRLKEIEQIVAQTLEAIGGGQANQDRPQFMFHAGANLLVVIGQHQAIEVARQVINALPGQQPVLATGGGMPARYGPAPFGPGGGFGGGFGSGMPPGGGGGIGPNGPGVGIDPATGLPAGAQFPGAPPSVPRR